jgi:uncharacterized membrane protein YwaF
MITITLPLLKPWFWFFVVGVVVISIVLAFDLYVFVKRIKRTRDYPWF